MSGAQTAVVVAITAALLATFCVVAYRVFLAAVSPLLVPVPYAGTSVMGLMLPLLNEAKREVMSRGGELEANFWCDSRVLAQLGALLQRGVRVRIICGPHLDVKDGPFFAFLMRAQDEGLPLEVRWAAGRSVPHFTVIDGRYLCLEQSHQPFERLKAGAMGASALAPRFAMSFDEAWEQARSLDRGLLTEWLCGATPLPDLNAPGFGLISGREVSPKKVVPEPSQQHEIDECTADAGLVCAA